jgi:hypothetical protein
MGIVAAITYETVFSSKKTTENITGELNNLISGPRGVVIFSTWPG